VSALELTRQYHFSAGHRLESPTLSPGDNARLYGQCYRQHGHNYLVEVTVQGQRDPLTGMAADLVALDATVKRLVLDRVDHYDLSSAVPAPCPPERFAASPWSRPTTTPSNTAAEPWG
jgi:6-pyruvoyltetrahydropterin/6-carboxytetrahydropterin synthase